MNLNLLLFVPAIKIELKRLPHNGDMNQWKLIGVN